MIDVLLFISGAALAWLTLKDVFDTVVVPGGGRNSLQVTRRIGFALLTLWKRVRRHRGISGSFAPFVLVTSFAIWMCALALGFGMMAYGVRSHFDPPIESFWDAVYESGSALATVGLSPHYPTGAARWVIVAAGFCGLAVMTMAVTYLLEVQSSISRRDTGIIKLNVSAGDPPSALTLLERFAAIRYRSTLPDDLEEARNWCATVQQSHSAHPSLIYFRSVSTGPGWPAALGALLDLALFSEKLIDDDQLYGPAILLREEGTRMARELALIASIQPLDSSTRMHDLEQVAVRLASSGYALRAAPDFGAIAKLRDEYMQCVEALADHLGRPPALLVR
ncbi:MAG: ion channel [Sphingomicrobium sp.]